MKSFNKQKSAAFNRANFKEEPERKTRFVERKYQELSVTCQDGQDGGKPHRSVSLGKCRSFFHSPLHIIKISDFFRLLRHLWLVIIAGELFPLKIGKKHH